MSNAEEIGRLKKLLDEGAITQEEFDKEKEKILSGKIGKYFLLRISGSY